MGDKQHRWADVVGVGGICELYITWDWRFGDVYCIVVWGCGAVRCSKSGLESGKFYGMELPRVGAFTENRGSGYRKPVQISGENRENHLKSGN